MNVSEKPKMPLPWRLSPNEQPPCIETVPADDGEFGDTVTGLCNPAGDYDPCPEDAAYIIRACNALPALEAENARLAILADALVRVDRCHRCDSDVDSESVHNITNEPEVKELLDMIRDQKWRGPRTRPRSPASQGDQVTNMTWQKAPGATLREQKAFILRHVADGGRVRLASHGGNGSLIRDNGRLDFSLAWYPDYYELLLPAPLRDVGKDPKVGDVVTAASGIQRTVKAVTDELVACAHKDGVGAVSRDDWAAQCAYADKIVRVEETK